MTFLPTDTDLFFTRNDPNDPRLGEIVTTSLETQFSEATFMGGYPDDEAIDHNGGRPGASFGPNAIRSRLYRMTPPAFHQPARAQLNLVDIGNLPVRTNSLEERHQLASETAFQFLQNPNHRWIGLGGGHDYGFPDGEAFLKATVDGPIRPIVINFDAHLDVRPLKEGRIITSGTPFYRLLNAFKGQFDFIEVGLQPYCNSQKHFQWLKEMNGHALSMPQIRSDQRSLTQQILDELGIQKDPSLPRPCFLSVDIDVFTSAVAPGCSQSWPGGMSGLEFFPCFQELCNIFSVRALGVYEVSPPLDQDEQTAKLAAEIIYHYLYS